MFENLREIKSWLVRLIAGLLVFALMQCSVHIDTDPFYHRASAAASVLAVTAQACADAADPTLDEARREAGVVLCALGAYAIGDYDDRHHH